MKENQWLHCKSPRAMLLHVRGLQGNQWRRWVLFNIACCRRIWHLLEDECIRGYVDTVQRLVDVHPRRHWHWIMLLSKDKPLQAFNRLASWTAFGQSLKDERGRFALWNALWLSYKACQKAMRAAEASAAARSHAYAAVAHLLEMNNATRDHARMALTRSLPKGQRRQAKEDEEIHQTGLIRCIFGNPHRTVHLDGSLVNKHSGMIQLIAKQCYGQESLGELHFLADALRQVGCTEDEMLAHCQSHNPHVRGCWVLDVLVRPWPKPGSVAAATMDHAQCERSKAEAAAALLDALADPDGNYRTAAALALARAGPGVERFGAIPRLVAALRDTDVHVRSAAAAALGNIRDRTAIPALLAKFEDRGELHHTRLVAADSLAKLRPLESTALPGLVGVLGDPSGTIRAAAANLLVLLGPQAAPAIPALVSKFTDMVPDVRRSAAAALGAMGPAACEAVPALESLMNDSYKTVRDVVRVALQAIGKEQE